MLTTETTSPAGFRFYGVAGRARLRISRPGFHPYEAEIDIHDHLTHDLSLSPINLTGTYTLTLSASSPCRLELPESMRTRRYPATVAQVDGSLLVTVHSPLNLPGIWNDIGRFTGAFGENDDVTFQQFGFEEWFPEEPFSEFHASGQATATISEGGLSGFLNGYMRGIVPNEDGRGNRVVTCAAPDHGAVFLRQ